MKRTALYIRVSTARQDQEGYSIPLQKERLYAYCQAMGWLVAGVYVDPGHSGSTLSRPGIEALIDGVEAGKFDVVLVYKLDRLSRSQKDTLHLIEDVFIANRVDFVSMQESFDTSTIYGRAMVGMLSVFAQMERETITERTLMGRVGRAETGAWHGGGTEPIGYDYIDGALVVNEKEAEQVRLVYRYFADGLSVTEISRRMGGFSTKHGGWQHTSTVGNVLDNPLYAGTVHFDGVVVPGRHPAIIPPDLDGVVKARRERIRRLESFPDSRYLLTGLIYCASCGARYFPNRRPNGTIVYSCHSRAKKSRKMVKDPGCKAPHLPLSKLDAMVEAEVLRLAGDPAYLDECIKKRAVCVDGPDLAAGKAAELRLLDAEIEKLMDLYQHGDLVAVEEIAIRIQAAHERRRALLPESKEKTKMKAGKLGITRSVLNEFQSCWDLMDTRGKRAILVQLISRVLVSQSGIEIDWSL